MEILRLPVSHSIGTNQIWIFSKNFFDRLSGTKKPLSHHEDVIGAEIEKAR